jgi:hypothetical protein
MKKQSFDAQDGGATSKPDPARAGMSGHVIPNHARRGWNERTRHSPAKLNCACLGSQLCMAMRPAPGSVSGCGGQKIRVNGPGVSQGNGSGALCCVWLVLTVKAVQGLHWSGAGHVSDMLTLVGHRLLVSRFSEWSTESVGRRG